MGLISDYLEECRDNLFTGNLDPCMIISDSIKSDRYSYYKINNVLNEYAKNSDGEKGILLRQQLVSRAEELETIKIGYILGEKNVLEFLNSSDLKSPLIIDIVQVLLSELRKSYQAICGLRQQINDQLRENVNVRIQAPKEDSVRKKILYLISSSLLVFWHKDSVKMDTSEFRKVIFDFAELIRYFEEEQYNQPAKKVVAYYLEKSFNMKTGNCRCSGCGNFLLKDIPYCINCYERN